MYYSFIQNETILYLVVNSTVSYFQLETVGYIPIYRVIYMSKNIRVPISCIIYLYIISIKCYQNAIFLYVLISLNKLF